jgi:hypothetical protein
MDRGLIDPAADPREANVTWGCSAAGSGSRSGGFGSSGGGGSGGFGSSGGFGGDKSGGFGGGKSGGFGRSDAVDKMWAPEEFWCKLELIKAIFLKESLYLMDADVCAAQTVQHMASLLDRLKTGADIGKELNFAECTGIKENDFSRLLDDCFEITPFHTQVPGGKALVSLHLMRRYVRMLVSETAALSAADKSGNTVYTHVLTGLYQIINTLSRMICAAFGSTACQKV